MTEHIARAACSIPDAAAIAVRLVDWLPSVRRDLPWRRRRDPYAVWISEIMLQQTQVATVVPYFERWLARFPDIHVLAAAALTDVLKAWEGLGYYARGRNLHRAAQQIVERHGGHLPADRHALLALPGIGRYTAGAILSLAFGQPEPVLDGNARRVLCRVYDVAEDPRQTATEKWLWTAAAALIEAVPDGVAGDLNEALMELGALTCAPRVPDCPACPLADLCLAHVRGVETARPVRAPARRSPHQDVTAGIIQDAAGRYLIVQRGPNGLLGGLWGFPGGPVAAGESPTAGLVRAVRAQVGIDVAIGEPVAQIKHAYTHFRITLHAYACRLIANDSRPRPLPQPEPQPEPQPLTCADVRWVTPAELTAYPFPVTDQRVWQAWTGRR